MVAFICLLIPHSRQGTAQQGAEWGLIKAINPLFPTAFEATVDKLQLIRTALITKMKKKTFIKLMNYARFNTFSSELELIQNSNGVSTTHIG